mgnify:CR=1 FL=1
MVHSTDNTVYLWLGLPIIAVLRGLLACENLAGPDLLRRFNLSISLHHGNQLCV